VLKQNKLSTAAEPACLHRRESQSFKFYWSWLSFHRNGLSTDMSI